MQIIRSENSHSVPARQRTVDYPITPVNDTPFTHYLGILWAHKFIFSFSVLACLGIAALANWSISPVYQARGSLELQTPPSQSYGGGREENSGPGSVAGQPFDAYLETQIGIIQSDSMIRRVINNLKLDERMNA